MAPCCSMLLKAALAAAVAIRAVAIPTGPKPALRASSALETGHHGRQDPSLYSALGNLPDLPPIGGPSGISAAINQIPAATAFFRGHEAAGGCKAVAAGAATTT